MDDFSFSSHDDNPEHLPVWSLPAPQSSRTTPRYSLPHIPDEIWCKIVREVFKSDSKLFLSTNSSNEIVGTRIPSTGPISGQLLRVNWLFLREGRSFLYGQTIQFQKGTNKAQFRQFFDMISINSIREIKKLEINYDDMAAFRVDYNRNLRGLEQLQNLTINCEVPAKALSSSPFELSATIPLRLMSNGRLHECFFHCFTARHDYDSLPPGHRNPFWDESESLEIVIGDMAMFGWIYEAEKLDEFYEASHTILARTFRIKSAHYMYG